MSALTEIQLPLGDSYFPMGLAREAGIGSVLTPACLLPSG